MKRHIFSALLFSAVIATAQSVDPLSFALEGPVKSVSGVKFNNPYELTVTLEFDNEGFLSGYVYNGEWHKLSVSSGTTSRYSDVDNGVPIRRLQITPSSESQVTVPVSKIQYDADRHIIAYAVEDNADVGGDTQFTRNADGDVVKEVVNLREWNAAKERTEKSKKVKTYTITARDRWGNWTERTWKCGKESGTDRRTFTYYSSDAAKFGIEYELTQMLSDPELRRQSMSAYAGGLLDGYMARPDDIRDGNVPVAYSDCCMSLKEIESVNGSTAKAKVFVGKGSGRCNFPTMCDYDMELRREGRKWRIHNMTCPYTDEYRIAHPEIGSQKAYDMLEVCD